jgi:hypothetical protein
MGDAAVDYGSLYSAGVDLRGDAWDRPGDNIGVGYAYLTGGNQALARSQVAEAYYRLVVLPMLAITADVQYQRDDLRSSEGPEGWVLGLRITTHF